MRIVGSNDRFIDISLYRYIDMSLYRNNVKSQKNNKNEELC
jgi:hypothetical protein